MANRAVFVHIMDISGSMTAAHKAKAKLIFESMKAALSNQYAEVICVYIKHHTSAQFVQKEDFYSTHETGGTIVSSALIKLLDWSSTIPTATYDIVVAQCTDGDNWSDDNELCYNLLEDDILPKLKGFFYYEILGDGAIFQGLYENYAALSEIHPEKVHVQTIPL